ncbi:MAG: type II secretion system F family protein [Candidatus Gastranaerophilaceae bacterium]|jgi:type II secretory pathway component PulF
MPIYNYVALKDGKEIVKGKIEALSSKEARSLISKMGLIPTRIFDSSQKSQEELTRLQQIDERKKVRFKKLSMREKIDFTKTMQILTKTGVPIIEALMFLEANTTSKKIQIIAQEIRKQIIAGNTFAETMNKFPQIFDYVYTGLVKAGEESGELDVTLERLSVLLDKQDKLKSKVVGTLIYPAFVIVLAICVILIMLIFVFPPFKEMYDGMGAKLPLITQICMDAGIFLNQYWYIIPVGFGGIFYGINFLFQWPVSKRKIDEICLEIPLFKNFVKYSSLSNFVSVMQVAYDAGVPIIDCLYLSNLTIHNFVLKDAVKTAAQKVQQGTHLSMALKSTNVMPGIILFMVSTGEQSGKLGEMLGQASEFIDIELQRIIDSLTKLVEPAMLIIIGCIVLVLALALYLPLFQSYANMG